MRHDANMLERLAYVSRALIAAPDPAMRDLAAASERNNARLGITGALYYDGRCFFQVIEGDPAHIDLLRQRIAADPRHTEMALLDRARIARRRFGPWRMKMVDGRPYLHLIGVFGYDSLRKADGVTLERRMTLLARL